MVSKMLAIRRKHLLQEIKNCGMDAVLIMDASNLYYYTGFTGGDGMYLCFHDEPDQGMVITDSRYYEQVELECKNLTLVPLENRRYSEVIRDIVSKRDNKHLRIAVEDTMNLLQYLRLGEACDNCSFEPANEAIMQSRMVKDENEVALIAKAESIGDAAFSHILSWIKPGVSEREISLELEYFMKKQGASKLSFDTIVASGPNSSMPHAQVTDRKIQQGDFVTMDFGCVYKGYCSDMTRTIAIGKPTDEMRKVYHIVLEANRRAMDSIKEGIPCNEIDEAARGYIANEGYGQHFGHGLGHGVGLDIHEEPRFSPKCNIHTKENMVITNEPGIYIPGQFGVRIEDLVVVKKNGCDILSHSDKELIII